MKESLHIPMCGTGLCMVILMLVLSAVGLAASNTADVGTIPFIEKDGFILIEGWVENRKGLFIVDTGADHLFLDQSERSSYHKEEFNTAGGSMKLGLTQVSTFQIGNRVWSNLDGYAIDLCNIEDRIGEDLAGIIGISFLLPSTLIIDHDRKELSVNTKDLEEGMMIGGDQRIVQVPMQFGPESLPIITLDIDGVSYRMGLDSGAGINVIYGKKAKYLRKSSGQVGDKQKVILPGNVSRRLKSFYPSMMKLKEVGVQEATFLLGHRSNLPLDIDGLINLNLLGFDKYIIDTDRKKLFLFVDIPTS